MKFLLTHEDGTEEEYEVRPPGSDTPLDLPLLFRPKIGGRTVPLKEIKDVDVIRELVQKSVNLDTDYRAYYYAEVFLQMLKFKDFARYFHKRFIVNYIIDPDGRFVKLLVEYCPDGTVALDEDEHDLILDEAFR